MKDEFTNFDYEKIFEFANDAMLIHCAKSGKVLKENIQAVKLYGAGRTSLVGCSVGELSTGDRNYKNKKAIELIKQAFSSGELLTFEWETMAIDGSKIPIECNLKRLGSSSNGLVLAMSRDITERKAADRRLKENSRYYKRLMSASSDGIALIDPNGNIVFVSESIKLITGHSAHVVRGRSIYDVVHPVDALKIRSIFSEIKSNNSPLKQGSIYFRLKNKKGNWTTQEGRFKNYLGRSNFNYLLVNFRDVTERLREEEELLQKDRKLNHLARLSLAGEVSASIAHELNQPLFAAVNYVSGCKNRLISNQPKQEIIWGLQMAQKELTRAGEVVNVIKNFTRKKKTSPKNISIQELIDNSYNILQLQVQNGFASCNFEVNFNPSVFCDEILMQQVMSNLVSNALEAMKGLPPNEKVIDIKAEKFKTNFINISILDRGKGMPDSLKEDRSDNLFFTTKEEGLGLGLSLCRKIVKAHNGSLTVNSRRDGIQGTEVSFTLPILQDNL